MLLSFVHHIISHKDKAVTKTKYENAENTLKIAIKIKAFKSFILFNYFVHKQAVVKLKYAPNCNSIKLKCPRCQF